MKKLYQFFALTILVIGAKTMVHANPAEQFMDAALAGHWHAVHDHLACPVFHAHIEQENANRQYTDPNKHLSSLFFVLQSAAFFHEEEMVAALLNHRLSKKHITDSELHTLITRVDNSAIRALITNELKRRNPKADCSSCWCC